MVEICIHNAGEVIERKEGRHVGQEGHSYEEESASFPGIDQSLAFKMGLVSLLKFGILDDYLRWVRAR